MDISADMAYSREMHQMEESKDVPTSIIVKILGSNY